MSQTDPASVSRHRHYGDHRPYAEPPERLADLTGPTSGPLELPITIHWGPDRNYEMDRDADRCIVYERVLREAATTAEIARYVNGEILVQVWPRLFLPVRIREMWQSRFPELRPAA